ncbi:hypothetical protein N5V81_13700 [Escherichia coli]|nr:hypothetical protein [Escherichia coli]
MKRWLLRKTLIQLAKRFTGCPKRWRKLLTLTLTNLLADSVVCLMWAVTPVAVKEISVVGGDDDLDLDLDTHNGTDGDSTGK